MKLSLRKSFRAIMKGCLTLASAFVIISVNSTCMGPGYQPRIPDTANRFKSLMKASISIVRIWIHLGLIPSADVSLYIWALDYLFFNLLTWGTLLFLGFVFNCVPRCLLFLILYLPLRIYAGGFHAKTKIGCYLISAFTFLFVVLYPADTTIHFYHLVFPCISTCIIYYFSPVSATNKPLDDLEALHYKKMARKILFSEILFFLLILLIFNTQITFAFFFSFTIHLSVLALQITVELVSKNFFANL